METKDDSVKREVKVREGFEYSTHIVSIYDKTEYYYNSFVLASSIVTEIVNKTDDYNLKVKSCEYSEDSYILSYPNNIISFCADRGQGKTSAMVPMAEALKTEQQSEATTTGVYVFLSIIVGKISQSLVC